MRTSALPMLYGMSRLNKVKQWEAKVQENDNATATIIIESGYVGGKIKSNPKIIRVGKNIGKSNETTPFDQAVSEIASAWNGKRYENYELDMLDPNNYTPRLMLPQLAKGMGKGKIIYPCFAQPKLNGICNLAESVSPSSVALDDKRGMQILHHSRGGHLFETLEHLDKWLVKLNAPAPTHGELYYHGWSLQTIGGYTKKIRPDQHKLEYWLYDMAWIGPVFEERMEWLYKNISELANDRADCPIKFTPTVLVNNYEEAKHYHDIQVQQGFEGVMLKNKKGVYMFQYNSNEIEKLKAYQDSEFEIIGGKEGVGTDEGCIVYRCTTEDGLEFDARPRGTVENRKEMFINLPNDIGKMLTVRYAELSDSGVPLQPVGVPAEAEAVRDYE